MYTYERVSADRGYKNHKYSVYNTAHKIRRTEKVRCIYIKENIQERYKETKSPAKFKKLHSFVICNTVLNKTTDFI